MALLFTYGTLEIPDVMRAVTGRDFAAAPARLRDYARFLLRDKVHPGILHAPGGEVSGVLYRGVDRDALERLDAFEGDFYRRTRVGVQAASGESLEASAYVVRRENRARLSTQPWDRERFVTHHLEAFLPHCRAFREQPTRRPAVRPHSR